MEPWKARVTSMVNETERWMKILGKLIVAGVVIFALLLGARTGIAAVGGAGSDLDKNLVKNWTGAPRSPQRTWAEDDMFRMLFPVQTGCAGRCH